MGNTMNTSRMVLDIFTDQTENAESDVIEYHGDLNTIYAFGEFDGATVKLQVSPNRTKWFDLVEATFTEEGEPVNISISAPYIKGVVEDAGDNTNINLMVR